MTVADILPKIANLQDAEREAGAPLRTPDALRAQGYRLVQERDSDRCFLAHQNQLQPLLARLGDIAEVHFGIKTGANEFVYLEPVGTTVAQVMAGEAGATVRVKNSAGWQGEIETDWLRPVIKSPRELKTLRVRPEDLRYLVFMPHDDLRPELPQLAVSGKLKNRYPKAWAYIHWGESKGYQKRSTCTGRPKWWDLGDRKPAKVNCN
ncbi:MAG: hypothetical protein ACK4ME_12190 [Fimbriimonadales bacterium]